MEAVVKIMERGMAAGIFHKADPLYMTLCLEGAFRNVGLYWIQEEPTDTLSERIKKVKNVLLNMICANRKGNQKGPAE